MARQKHHPDLTVSPFQQHDESFRSQHACDKLWIGLVAMLVIASATNLAVAQGDAPFPAIYNSEKEPGDPISPVEALSAIELPSGFSASLFASEPDVQNPIAACTDAQGRIWVAENYTYSERAIRFDLDLNDRVIVLEDTDNDGVSDRRTVFLDNLKVLTGVTVGRGGVWLMCPPQLLFVPDADGDLVPDGPPEVRLDGFHNARENYHNFANGLSWGPDSWLYGRCGASCPGDVGVPGSTDQDRIPVRGGMWRYHPEKQQFEALVQGTTNPWGHDWNDRGDLFYINTVNGHFWHCIPGAHFVRPHTIDVNPNSYELIDTHADHWHFDTGKNWTASRNGAANEYGGGHAHIGMVLYQEDAWPQEFRNCVMTVNMHGRRVNRDTLRTAGSGYVASHAEDFLLSGDEWFRGMELLPLPDGNLLLIDWSDTGECHEQTGVHRTSGRIFKLKYDAAKAQGNPLADAETRSNPLKLAQVQLSGSSWHSRRARELLVSWRVRHESASPDYDAAASLLRNTLAKTETPLTVRLKALWGLIALDATDAKLINTLLQDSEPALRSWAIRMAVDNWRLDTAYGSRPQDEGSPFDPSVFVSLVTAAQSEASPAVRLQLASALQRVPLVVRHQLAQPLVQFAEDAEDHNLPLMVWYGLTPLGESHSDRLLDVLDVCQWPVTRRLIARRVADKSKSSPAAFDRLFEIAARQSTDFQADVVLGTARALAGWRKAKRPEGWADVAANLAATKNADVANALQNLNVLFGDGRTIDQLVAIVKDGQAPLELRQSSLQSLVDSRAPGTKELCVTLLKVRFLNLVAATGLARESAPDIGVALVDNYRRFHPSERPQVLSILTTRATWAVPLLNAVAAGKIGRDEITPYQARQLANLEDPQVSSLLAKTWGQVRPSSDQIEARIKNLRNTLTPEVLALADASNGRRLFQKSCANCHRLFGEGGQLGPELTGAQRANMDYLLENIVDPSAVVTKEFRASVLLLEDERVLTGLITENTENVVTLATQNEVFRVDRTEIVAIKESDQSTMPSGLLDQLSEQEIRDLFAYLQSTRQVTD